MTGFLLRIFVKNYDQLKSPEVRSRVGSLSGAVGIVCNFLLFLGKVIIGTLVGSVSVVADAWNNLSDASSAIVTLLGFRLARQPADEDHPYGHARFEYLSGLAVAAMIIVIGFELAKTSVEKILQPTAVTVTPVAVAVLAASVAVKLWMYRFNRKLGGMIQSTALVAAAADSRNDCIATTAVLGAALAERFFDLRIDGIMGLGVALFVLRSGWNLVKETISPLLGEAASPELREQIVDYIGAQPQVLGYHDLMVHDYGPGQRFASIHVEMDASCDPLYCHELIDSMERECLTSHNIHLVIHYDPVVTNDPEITRLREKVTRLLKARDPRLSAHDFRIGHRGEDTVLIFDVSLPADLQNREAHIREGLEQELNEKSFVTYRTEITFDPAGF